MAGAVEDDADAGGDVRLVALHVERGAKGLRYPLGDPFGVAPAPNVLEQHDELVAAEARDGVFGPHRLLEPLGDRDEDPIARLLTRAARDPSPAFRDLTASVDRGSSRRAPSRYRSSPSIS